MSDSLNPPVPEVGPLSGAPSPPAEPAGTVGELRARLKLMGDPWAVDPSLPDDAPLPTAPSGPEDGDGAALPPTRRADRQSIDEIIRSRPPSNPDLLELWRDRGFAPSDADATSEDQP